MDKKKENLKRLTKIKKQKDLEKKAEQRKEKAIIAIKAKQKNTKILFIIFVLALAVSYFLKGSFVDYKKIHPNLLNEPIQTDTEAPEITHNYKGRQYLIKPVKDYSITGLVVSHNNTTGFGDLYHDEKSFDTKDLCIIWGDNLKSNDFHKVKFWNVSWTCNAKWNPGTKLYTNKLSNNHLITIKESVRDQIADIRVGDQITLKGKLVNYTTLNSGGWRNSSLTREDTGNTACEVVLVDSVKIIKKGTPLWYNLFFISKWGALITFVVLIFFFVRSGHLRV